MNVTTREAWTIAARPRTLPAAVAPVLVGSALAQFDGVFRWDSFMLAMLGAWMGWQMLPVIILLSSAVGAVVGITLIIVRGRNRNIPIPFGPYLAAAGWIAFLWGHDITSFYLRYSGMQQGIQ